MTTTIQAAADAEYQRIFGGLEPDPDVIAHVAQIIGPAIRQLRDEHAAQRRDAAA